MSVEFSAILEEHGIICEMSVPYTPQQNSLAKQVNQTLIRGAHAMM